MGKLIFLERATVTLTALALLANNMLRRNCLSMAIFGFLLMVIPTTIAAPSPVATANHNQGVFGGVSIEVSNSTNASSEETMSSMPNIVEVFTATWCENCVDSEEGLMLAIDEADKQSIVLTYHRAIMETEDPFGVEKVENRWIDQYGDASLNAVGVKSAAPSTVINGELLHAGSGGLGSVDLKPIFAESLASQPYFSDNSATSSLSWSSGDTTNGTISWNLDAGDWLPESTSSLIFVVEESATFEEGSNGQGDYHDVIRDMIELTSNSGSMSYSLPEAWDGEDLSLVLIHQWEVVDIVIEPPNNNEDGFFGLSAIGLVGVVLGLVGAAILPLQRSARC